MQQSYKLLAISHWLLDTRITEETLPHLPISPYFPSLSPYFLRIVAFGRKYGTDDGVSYIRKTDNQEVVDENSCTFVNCERNR